MSLKYVKDLRMFSTKSVGRVLNKELKYTNICIYVFVFVCVVMMSNCQREINRPLRASSPLSKNSYVRVLLSPKCGLEMPGSIFQAFGGIIRAGVHLNHPKHGCPNYCLNFPSYIPPTRFKEQAG